MKKCINIDGVDYVPREFATEALSIIAGLSELYDNLAAHPSEPIPDEVRTERKLSRRWNVLMNKVYPPEKKQAKA
jgi:hypothetical protein